MNSLLRAPFIHALLRSRCFRNRSEGLIGRSAGEDDVAVNAEYLQLYGVTEHEEVQLVFRF
jgi:hypothetical protein